MNERQRPTSRGLAIYESPGQARRSAWVEMVHAFIIVERQVVALLGKHDMTLPQFDLLATLRFSEGATQQELAQRLLVTKGNVVGLIDRLETAGWVERRQDKKDARANRLHLTSSGRRKIEKVLPDHDVLIERIFSCVADDELATLRQCMAKLSGANQP